MGLQLVIGGSGSGKSYYMYKQLIDQAIACPQEKFIVIVPEQYTMETQKNIVAMHPAHGVMNIDILSFARLGFRVFEELGVSNGRVLMDTGKRMVIRKVLEAKRQELSVFTGSVRKAGFSGELKSMLSELLQYNISLDQLETCIGSLPDGSVLKAKLKDLWVVYQGFKNYIQDHYLTAEEILVRLCPYIGDSKQIRESRIYLDNFNGLTPAQYMVMEELLKYSRNVQMTLTIDPEADPYSIKNNHELFYLTKDTLYRLEKLCQKIHCDRLPDIFIGGEKGRFKRCPDLAYLEKNIYRPRAKIYGEKPNHLFLYTAQDPAAETRHIARHIRRLVRDKGYRYRDMGVICADVSGYRHIVERAFSMMDIPCFIDMKRSILDNSFVECLRALLDMFCSGFSYEGVFCYLRCGFSEVPADDIDLLENYAVAFGLRGAKAWQETWMKRPDTFDEGMMLAVNQAREKAFENVWPVYEVFRDKETTVAVRTDALKQWIAHEKIGEKLQEYAERFEEKGDLSMAGEYRQVLDAVMDLLDKMGNILGDEIISVREYAQILEAGLNEEKIGLIPPGIDQVTVGDIQRTRLGRVKVLFFIGVNEGIVPAPAKDGGILSDRDKEVLASMNVELAPTARQNSFYEQFYIYAALSRASDRLYLSFTQMDGEGKALRPSSLIRRIKNIFPKLETVDSHEDSSWESWVDHEKDGFFRLADGFGNIKTEVPKDEWKELFSWFSRSKNYGDDVKKMLDAAFYSYICRPLSQAAVRALYGSTLENSVTTLENYAACAYAHFLQYGLGLAPRQEHKIRTPDLGIILHQALEMFASALKERGYTWKDVPEPMREELSESCAVEAARFFNHTALLENRRSQYQIRRLVRYVLRTTWAIKQQLGRGDFLPDAFELRFDSDALEGLTDIFIGSDGVMKLKGTIDRIDLCFAGDNVYVKIVDYKSGNDKFDIVQLYEGLSLQLVVYMNAARAMEEKRYPGKKIIPAGILYYNIDDPMADYNDFSDLEGEELKEAVEESLLQKLKSNGLINSSPEVIRRFDKEFTKDSPVIPVSYTSSGALSKRSSVATSRQFDELGRYVEKKVEQLGRDILDGKIDINPYMRGDKNACAFCLFQSVCQFDQGIDGFSYRRFNDMSAGEAWEAIHRWNEERKEADDHGCTVDEGTD